MVPLHILRDAIEDDRFLTMSPELAAMRTIRHVVIRGRVQGVGYRAWVVDTAAGLNLEGWVRNRRDGSVEAVFAGDDEIVAAMIAQCRNGPSMARVDDVRDDVSNDDELKLRRANETFSVLATL